MTQFARVTHGPFRGYVSAYPKHSIDVADAGPDSRDYRYNPSLGKWVERAGSVILGDTYAAIAGLVPVQSQNLRTRQIFELPAVKDQAGAVQFADHYPAYGALYDIAFNPAVTSRGELYFRSSNSGGSNQRPVKSWSATTYPTTTRTGKSFIKAIPTWSQNGALLSRMGSGVSGGSTYDGYQYAGARKLLISGNWLYTPGLQCDGRRWNMLFNDSSGSPTRKERHTSIGIIPPLFPAFIKTADLPAAETTVRTWKKGERFFISMCYIFEDGTWSKPFIPSLKYGAAVTGGQNDNYGLVTLPAVTGTDYYKFIPWRNMPVPPSGCVGKALLRSPKVDSATGAYPVLNDLRITAIVAASVTSYDDYNGDDNGLRVDDALVRFDIIEPPRARYIGAFDGRVGIGYTQVNPRLIYLAPTGVTAPNDVTADDDAILGSGYYGSNLAYGARITGTSLQLRKITPAPGYPQAPVTFTIAMAGLTVQGVVDAINATLVSDTANEWRAQLVPGADGTQPSTALASTDGFSFGDDGIVSGDTGNMVCHAQSHPGVLFWDAASLLAVQPQPDRLSFWHSSTTPASQAAGVSASPNLWLAANRRQPPDADSGIYMGLGALTDGTVLFYSKKVWLFRNTFAGRTGKDEDYRFDLLSNDGCISWDSIVEFNNAVGWLSAKGYKVTGGVPGDERLVSGAIFDPNQQTGDLTYEIGKCVASTAADLDDDRFHAHLFGHVLTIHYRSSSSASVPDFMHEYDFSEGAGSGGLMELFRSDGTPYGWSAPFRLPGEAMGHYRNSTGMVKLHAIETLGSAGSGRLDQFDTGYQDNGVAITPVLYTKMDDLGEPRRRHRERRFTLKYKSPTGHALTVTMSRDRARASAGTYTMENTGTAELATQTKRVKLAGQTPARVTEFKLSGTRVTAGAAEIWSLERELKLLDTPLDAAG